MNADTTKKRATNKMEQEIKLGRLMKRTSARDQSKSHDNEPDPNSLPVEVRRTIPDLVDMEYAILRYETYHNHLKLRKLIEEGLVTVIDEEDYRDEYGELFGLPSHFITKNKWEEQVSRATETEREVPRAYLAPYDDFELGMMRGRLHAIRWMMGESFTWTC